MSGLKKENGKAAVNKHNPSIPPGRERDTEARENRELCLAMGTEMEEQQKKPLPIFLSSNHLQGCKAGNGRWRCEKVAGFDDGGVLISTSSVLRRFPDSVQV